MSASGRDAPTAAHHRPHLDGLRAIAVYLVVGFHAGSGGLAGGYVGVDVFFVLSGFLVTQLLLRDLVGGAPISLRRFYARRFRRLFPAAGVVLIVTALVYATLASPAEVAQSVDGFQASFLYVANWQLIAQSSDYFGADIGDNPVLHFWALAVAAQFYLLWPLLLTGLVTVARRSRVRQQSIVRAVVAVGAVASLLWAWTLATWDPSRAHYGTDARAYQLLAGALLALSPGLIARLRAFPRSAGFASAGAIVALVVVASSWISLDAIERGVAATVITLTLLIALEIDGGGPGRRTLSVPTVVYLGKVSYGTYLWHWPTLLVIERAFDLSSLSTVALTTLIATALASLSFQILEQPVRLSALLDRHRTPVIVTGLAVSALSAVVLIPTILDASRSSTAIAAPATDGAGLTAIPAGYDWSALRTAPDEQAECRPGPAGACTLAEGSGASILLMGDSHAAMMIPAFVSLAESEDLTLSVAVLGGCPWQRDLLATRLEIPGVLAGPDCRDKKRDTYDRVIPTLEPDVIFVMNLGYEVPGQLAGYLNEDGTPGDRTSAEHAEWLARATADSFTRLESGGRTVVVLEPVPLPAEPFDPLDCLSAADWLEQCRYVVSTGPSALEREYRRLDGTDDRLWSVDLDSVVCPFLPICDPIVGGQVVKVDDTHLSPGFARSLAPHLADYLRSNGILP